MFNNATLSTMICVQSLYRTQVKELKEEVDEKQKQTQDLHSDIQNILHEKLVLCDENNSV